MIGHQAVGVDPYAEAFNCRGQIVNEFLPLMTGFVNRVTGIAAADDMVKCTGILYS
jgi:hypothetical protein